MLNARPQLSMQGEEAEATEAGEDAGEDEPLKMYPKGIHLGSKFQVLGGVRV